MPKSIMPAMRYWRILTRFQIRNIPTLQMLAKNLKENKLEVKGGCLSNMFPASVQKDLKDIDYPEEIRSYSSNAKKHSASEEVIS